MIALTGYSQNFTPAALNPGVYEAVQAWAGEFNAHNPRTARYITLFPWVHPDILDDRQQILAKIHVFYRFYDDFNDSLQNDIHTSREIANELIGIIDGEREVRDTAVTRMFRDIWQEHQDIAPAAFLARTGMHWKHYFATQSNYHAMLKPEYPWDMQEYMEFRLDNGGLRLAVTQGELADGIYIPAHIYRMAPLIEIRRLAHYCIILTNDLHSAVRDEQHGDHRNPIAQHAKHAGTTWEEAISYVQGLLFEYADRLHNSLDRLHQECDLLELTADERKVAAIAAGNYITHADGYGAWAHQNEELLPTPQVDPGLILSSRTS